MERTRECYADDLVFLRRVEYPEVRAVPQEPTVRVNPSAAVRGEVGLRGQRRGPRHLLPGRPARRRLRFRERRQRVVPQLPGVQTSEGRRGHPRVRQLARIRLRFRDRQGRAGAVPVLRGVPPHERHRHPDPGLPEPQAQRAGARAAGLRQGRGPGHRADPQQRRRAGAEGRRGGGGVDGGEDAPERAAAPAGLRHRSPVHEADAAGSHGAEQPLRLLPAAAQRAALQRGPGLLPAGHAPGLEPAAPGLLRAQPGTGVHDALLHHRPHAHFGLQASHGLRLQRPDPGQDNAAQGAAVRRRPVRASGQQHAGQTVRPRAP